MINDDTYHISKKIPAGRGENYWTYRSDLDWFSFSFLEFSDSIPPFITKKRMKSLEGII